MLDIYIFAFRRNYANKKSPEASELFPFTIQLISMTNISSPQLRSFFMIIPRPCRAHHPKKRNPFWDFPFIVFFTFRNLNYPKEGFSLVSKLHFHVLKLLEWHNRRLQIPRTRMLEFRQRKS